MTQDETARARSDALLGDMAALWAIMYRRIKGTGLSWVPEADIPEAWLSLLIDRHPGAAREHRYDGERMISATTLHAFLHDMDGLVSRHSLGQEIDHPPANDPDMPRLEDWFPAIVPEETGALARIGTVTGHPRLRDARPISTSDLPPGRPSFIAKDLSGLVINGHPQRRHAIENLTAKRLSTPKVTPDSPSP